MNQNPPAMPASAKLAPTTIRERLGWKISPELHETIHRVWVKHSIVEDKRDLQGLIDTLVEDCVYEIPGTGQRWEGHTGEKIYLDQAALGNQPN